MARVPVSTAELRRTQRSAYHRRKEIARIEGQIRLWTAIDPTFYADKIAELKAQLP